MVKKCFSLRLFLSLCLMFAISGVKPTLADVEFKDLNTVVDSAQIGFDQFLFYRVDTNPFHGADVPGGDDDSNFGEIVSKLRLTVGKKFGFADVEGQFALIYMSTIDLNMYGTANDEDDLTVNQAWIKFGALLGSPFSVTIGEQNVQIEKQFVVGIGQFNKYANWLFQDQSFPFAVKVDGDFGALKATMFWAESRDYWQNFDETILIYGVVDNVEVAGINLHFDFTKDTYIYGGLIAKIDESDVYIPGVFESDSQTLSWDFGFNVTLGSLLFEGEIVYQTGDAGSWGGSKDQDRDALGGFVSAAWNFGGDMEPWVKLQYDYFSGDKDFNDGVHDGDMEAYDPMFYGFPGWGRWFIGEIAGELHLNNSNRHVYIFETGFKPHPTTTVTALYLRNELDEKYAWLTPLKDDHWSDEVNLFIDWWPSEHLWIGVGCGYSEPGDAAEELLGDEGDFFVQTLIGFFL